MIPFCTLGALVLIWIPKCLYLLIHFFNVLFVTSINFTSLIECSKCSGDSSFYAVSAIFFAENLTL